MHHVQHVVGLAGVVPGRLSLPSVVSSQPNCKEGARAKIEQKGEVTLNAKVSWKPSTCNLVVQAYQGEQLVGEFGKEKGVRSGSISISQLTKGRGRDRIEGLGAQLDEPFGRNVGYGSSENSRPRTGARHGFTS